VTGTPPSTAGAGRVLSVNVGRPAEMVWHGRTVRSAIWKAPVIGPVRVRGVNLTGDVQADGKAHGGPDKAVYGYAAEDLDWWRGQLGVEVGPGSMGENLTTSDLDLSEAVVGERWEIGSVVLQVTQPRIPSYKLGIRMGDDRFPNALPRPVATASTCGSSPKGRSKPATTSRLSTARPTGCGRSMSPTFSTTSTTVRPSSSVRPSSPSPGIAGHAVCSTLPDRGEQPVG